MFHRSSERMKPAKDINLRASRFIRLQPFPQVDEYLLEQVVHLFRVFGEHIADSVDPPLVLQDDACKFSFSVVHKSVFLKSF